MGLLALAPVDMAIGLACLVLVLAGDVALQTALWGSIGVCCWWQAFKSQGQVRMREPVEDNVSGGACR